MAAMLEFFNMAAVFILSNMDLGKGHLDMV